MTKTTIGHAIFCLVAAAVAVGATNAYAGAPDQNTSQPPPPFMGRGPGGRGGPMGILPMLPKEIQLTDAQQAQLGTITGAHRDEWKALAGRERAAHEALNAAVTAENATGNVDETVIRQRSAEVAAVDADMAVARAHVHAEVWQILTADQKAKLAQLKAAVSARRPSPRGPR